MYVTTKKQTFLRRSGGIAFCVKDKLAKFTKHLESKSEYILWIQLDKCLVNCVKHVVLGISYVSPTQSKYSNDEEVLTLERDITLICGSNKYVLVTGDINTRTARLEDFVHADEFSSDILDFYNETRFFFNKINILEQNNIPVDRVTKDTEANNNGTWLPETCENKT